MSSLSVGIVGYGAIGQAHAGALAAGKIKGLTLTAVCDIDPAKLDRAAELYPQVSLYASHDLLLESEGRPDCLLVATPHNTHALISIDALNKGCHVLCEKPPDVRTSEVRKMQEAARKNNRTLAVMLNQRANKLFATARELVQTGQIGLPKRLVWIITNWYRTQHYYDSASWRASWKGEGGGVLLNQAFHNLDVWQWIFGMPEGLRADCSFGKYHDIEVEDDVTIKADYKNGASAVFIASTGEFPGTNRLEITGDRGKMVLEEGLLKLWLLGKAERDYCFDSSDLNPQIPFEYSEIQDDFSINGHTTILQNFADALLHGKDLISPGHDATDALTLANAAYLSAWTDSYVDLPLDEDAFNKLLKEHEDSSRYKPSEEAALSSDKKGYKKKWDVKW